MAKRFALLVDPGKLSLLLAVRRAGPIAACDLALAAGIRGTAVSQALRLLRASGAVQADKDGRIVRYSLRASQIAARLEALSASDIGTVARVTAPALRPWRRPLTVGRWSGRRCSRPGGRSR
ncbi:hypothetical protein GCM10010341_75380 [Streptomyces noursei]|nr:hypothetical protein GCM10010341_75380 [Streptomyces noursei]